MLSWSNTFDLIGLENQFLVFLLSDRLRQVLLYSEELPYGDNSSEDLQHIPQNNKIRGGLISQGQNLMFFLV